MAVNRYQQGANFERSVRENLTLFGYSSVRSAGSKSKVDIVAWKEGVLLFIQCKINGLCSPLERKTILAESMKLTQAFPIVAYGLKEGRSAMVPAYRVLTGVESYQHRRFYPDRIDH